MKRIFTILLLIAGHQTLIAQEINTADSTENESPCVNLYVDSRLDALANKAKQGGPKNTGKALRVRGYRVQIYNGPSKQEADKIKADFVKIYPRVRAYMTFNSPNYRLKVGDFKTRAEADEFVNTASRLFRTTMIIPDVVNNN